MPGRVVSGVVSPRVVSLVPSLTEAVAVSAPGALVGVTDWCTHPADLGAAVRIGGTKNPDVRAIAELRPDLVEFALTPYIGAAAARRALAE